MPEGLKKFIIVVSVLVFILFLGFITAAWFMGAFEPVDISRSENGPYYFFTFRSPMIYRQIPEKNEELKKRLAEYDINHFVPGALILDDPMTIPLSDINARGGLIIPDSIAVTAPYDILRIPRRNVVVAFIDANPAIATFKTYPALSEWLRNHTDHSAQLPFLEIYHPDESVSTEMPVVSVDSI
jgi:hypothetical protein